MEVSEHTLLILAAILFFGLVVPQFFKRLQLTFVSSLIIMGSVMGPNGFDYIQPNETLQFLGFLGATFHMLLAGFEAETLHINNKRIPLIKLAAVNMLIPLISGTAIVKLFGYSWESALFIGIIFISSSIMLASDIVKNNHVLDSPFGKMLKSLVVIEDITSLLLLFLVFKYIEPHSRFSLPILFGLLVSSIIILRMFLPEVAAYFFKKLEEEKAIPEAKLRMVIVLFLVVVVLYASLDVNPVIAAFLAGFVLSETPRAASVKEKLHTLGYGMFIPIYLFIIGINLDLKLFTELNTKNYLLLTLIAVGLLSKFVSGLIGGRILNYSLRESAVIGIVSSNKLSVAISATYTALALNLLDNTLYSAIIMLTVITTLISPLLVLLTLKKQKPQQKPLPDV